MKTFANLLILGLFIITGCTTLKMQKPESPIQSTFIGDAQFSQVWDAVIDELLDQNFQISTIEKESGIISTKPHVIDLKAALKYSFDGLIAHYLICDQFEMSLTIRIKSVENGKVQIKIVPEVVGIDFLENQNNRIYRFKTNGHFERLFVEKLNNRLKKSQFN